MTEPTEATAELPDEASALEAADALTDEAHVPTGRETASRGAKHHERKKPPHPGAQRVPKSECGGTHYCARN